MTARLSLDRSFVWKLAETERSLFIIDHRDCPRVWKDTCSSDIVVGGSARGCSHSKDK